METLKEGIEQGRLDELIQQFVSPFLRNGKSREVPKRIIIVYRDFRTRLYVAGALFDKLDAAGKATDVIEAENLPRNFTRGLDYAIDLGYYLQDNRRRVAELIS